jgi:hypothetical protein
VPFCLTSGRRPLIRRKDGPFRKAKGMVRLSETEPIVYGCLAGVVKGGASGALIRG